ncbi:MAG: type II toxin-antitoxin system Phd/YefM family antitoxin [Defluviicoccus sp.]
MRTVNAKDAKHNFGQLIDTASAFPVTVAKYDRPVEVVMAVGEFERLNALDSQKAERAGGTGIGQKMPGEI